MAEDKEYIDGLFEMNNEIQSIIELFNRRSAELSLGGKGKDALIALKVEQNAALVEALRKQRRILEFWQGKPIEPEAHTGEAVLLPAGGMN